MNTTDIIGWIRWIESGGDELEQETRAEKVWNHIFADGLEEEEKERREKLVEHVKEMRGSRNWEAFKPKAPAEPKIEIPAPQPSSPIGVPKPPESEIWTGLIPSISKAYRRAALHDGTGRELDRLRSLSRGSPFDVESVPEPMRNEPRRFRR